MASSPFHHSAPDAALTSRLQELELLLLRCRIEAHFIFNALNTMVGESHRGANVVTVVQSLADYFHFLLRAGDDLLLPFGDELDAVRAYLVVEAARYEETIEISYDTDAACRQVFVPGVFLQPLVENAIKHGRKTDQQVLRIAIHASYADQRFFLSVTNTGAWIPPIAPENPAGSAGGWGDGMIQRCLELLFPGRFQYGIRIEDGLVIAELSITGVQLRKASPEPASGYQTSCGVIPRAARESSP